MSNPSNEDPKEIRIRNVPTSIHQTLDNIAANLGVPTGSLIKMNLQGIVNSYPEAMRTKKD